MAGATDPSGEGVPGARSGPRRGGFARALVIGAGSAAWWPNRRLLGRWPGLAQASAWLGAALATEVENRRAFLWLPVAFGAGVGLYFLADREPWLPAGMLVAAFFGTLAFLARHRAGAFYLFGALTAVAAGFGISTLQVARLSHPVLAEPVRAAKVSGFVERAEMRASGGRVVLLVTALERAAEPPRRVRVSVGGNRLPEVGSHVTLRATLGPPPGPAYPGGYDFGRDAWFDGIGATGFAVGRVEMSAAPVPAPWSLQVLAWLDGVRRAMGERIRAALPEATGGIAAALVTGSRDAVPEAIEESMRVCGLSHVLSISGLHMALVASTLFFLARGLMALAPGLALRHPIKAWASVPAILGATFYLLLSGAEVATQRSYAMTLIVLAGIVIGRPALTLRTLAIAALAVLVLSPAALLDPGTQMSFAATLALVAAHEAFGRRLLSGGAEAGSVLQGRVARYVGAVVLTSLAAGLATAPYAAFHFQRLAPLSLVANLAAAPVVSFVVMPFGLIGALLMPFGLDRPAWWAMGWGIDMMTAISDAVAAIPGADRGVEAFPATALVLMSLALVSLCLLRSRLVHAVPAVLFGLALLGVGAARLPDAFIDAQGRMVGARGEDGHLVLIGDAAPEKLAERFAAGQWRAAIGERDATSVSSAGRRCDPLGCTLTVNGRVVAWSASRDSLADDCRLAAAVVTPYAPPRDCKALIIRTDPQRPKGAAGLVVPREGPITIVPARDPAQQRPWLPAVTRQAEVVLDPAPARPDEEPDGQMLPAPP
ncbi:ComEC/Rec2 family competence protein [Bosea sp. 117]|uniref:ComEC/Rec2 family competence protein n=1 Tax=Bosea sp. 117 TaxID=1125973 RepID=UPI00068A2ABF|nr:ComEC/Rec2 family competence protein [Bosea sp. 117]